MKINAIPVITIDGPSASGKGTVAQLVAQRLNYHYLDSGALYRLVTLKAMQDKINLTDEERLINAAKNLSVVFSNEQILLDGNNVSNEIRAEQCGIGASKIAIFNQVRQALMAYQRSFRKLPGLVTDGRDMGSVIFPDATLKIFLTASSEERAYRRYNQLKEKGTNDNIADLLKDIQRRDARDRNRAVAPLQQCEDAKMLDTTALSITQAVNQVLKWHTEICQNNS